MKKENNVDFIKPDMWLPNIRDLNPVDYAVWGAVKELRLGLSQKFTE